MQKFKSKVPNINKFLKNKKILSATICATTSIVLVGGAMLCQVKYNDAIVYASEVGATETVAKYDEQGVFVRPDTVDKIMVEADEEVIALKEQAIEIESAEIDLDAIISYNSTWNDTEVEAISTIETDYKEAKEAYLSDPTLENGDVYLASIVDLQSRMEEQVVINAERIEEESKEPPSNGYAYSCNTIEEAWNIDYIPACDDYASALIYDYDTEILIDEENGPYTVYKLYLSWGYTTWRSDTGEWSVVGNDGDVSKMGVTPVEPFSQSNPSTYTCNDIEAFYGVESIPECDMLEEDGIKEYSMQVTSHVVDDEWEENGMMYYIDTENYSFHWYSYTGEWEIWNINLKETVKKVYTNLFITRYLS